MRGPRSETADEEDHNKVGSSPGIHFSDILQGSAFLRLYENCFRIKCLLGTKEFSSGKSYHYLESQGSQLIGDESLC